MQHATIAVRVAGSWLAIASFPLIAALIAHGPLAPDLSDQMNKFKVGRSAARDA